MPGIGGVINKTTDFGQLEKDQKDAGGFDLHAIQNYQVNTRGKPRTGPSRSTPRKKTESQLQSIKFIRNSKMVQE